MGSVGLLYVGAVLFVNGVMLLGWVDAKSAAPINLIVGALQVVTPTYLIFTAKGDPDQILGASGLYLFGFTYLYVAITLAREPRQHRAADSSTGSSRCVRWCTRGSTSGVTGFGDNTFGVIWLNWAFLWVLFFVFLALKRCHHEVHRGGRAIQGWVTGRIPAFLLLTDHWADNKTGTPSCSPPSRSWSSVSSTSAAPQLGLAGPASRGGRWRCRCGHLTTDGHPRAPTAVESPPPPTIPRPIRTHDARVVFPLDSTKKFTDQKYVGHNRWHPDIPANVTVKPGDVFRVDCREWFDGAIVNDDSADDVLNAPLSTVHVLSGPIARRRRRARRPAHRRHPRRRPDPPGGLRPALRAGLGLHRRVRHRERRRLPHGAVPRRLQGHLGLPGRHRDVAPHPTRLVHRHRPPRPHGHRAVGRRSSASGTPAKRRSSRPTPTGSRRWRYPRCRKDAILGNAHRCALRPGRRRSSPHRTSARTVGTRTSRTSPRDPGCSIRSSFLAANLSMGDLHFSQGDGEITFCGAIEMGGFMDLHVDLIKGGMEAYGC